MLYKLKGLHMMLGCAKTRSAGTSPAGTGYLTEKQIIRQRKPDSHSEADWLW